MLKYLKNGRTDTIASTVDHIGRMQTAVRELEQKIAASKKELVSLLKENDAKTGVGDMYRVVLVEKDQPRVDWKTIAQKFKPSPQLVRANTKVVHSEYPVITMRRV